MNISHQMLWKAQYKNVQRLARWLRKRGDIREPLPKAETLTAKIIVINAVSKVI